ncbi:hypothetical protein ACHQM5_007194 [Ranunculus cassubicifolius]
MKLNLEKCVFGVTSGKFLGYMITNRGIEADPEKVRAVCDKPAPKTKRQIQKLNGMIVAINKFISQALHKTKQLLHLLKKGASFSCDDEYKKCFNDIKQYLLSPLALTAPSHGDILGLYLGASEIVASGVLFKMVEQVEKPIYYISKTMSPQETRYSDIEKLALALKTTTEKCREITQRMVKWKQQIGDFHIEFHPRVSTKGQVIANFLVEMSFHDNLSTSPGARDPILWTIFTDGSDNKDGSGAGYVLISPEGVQWKFSIRLNFMVKSNGAKYEALISAPRQANDYDVKRVHQRIR